MWQSKIFGIFFVHLGCSVARLLRISSKVLFKFAQKIYFKKFARKHFFPNAKIVQKPFPYLIIDDALPSDYYNKLNDSFPDYSKIINNNEFKQNFAYRYSAHQSLKDDNIAEI